MTKQEAWEAWVRPIAGHLVTALADSSHGKAFSAGWDAANQKTKKMRKLLMRAADALPAYTNGKNDRLLDAIDKELA